MQKIVLLSLLVLVMILAYIFHALTMKYITPRRSFKHFIVYMIVNLAAVFGLVFLVSLLIFKYKDFLFKK